MRTKHLVSLLHEQVNEILISEILTLEILPIVQNKISSTHLLKGIRDLKKLIRNQNREIQRVLNKLNAQFKKVRSEEFEMLLAELVNVTEYSSEPELIDHTIADKLSKLTSFQLSCYGAASIYASTLGENEIAEQLQQLIQEKKACLQEILTTVKGSLDDK